ncbi:MAG: restriction endonuclease subunit R, partial [Roseomonas sp.]|nr:restriction endonuclease subunit R [Roseomonas sp.]
RPGFAAWKDRVVAVGEALAENKAIPAIAAEMELILAVQTEAWWQDITVHELENARRRLRGLVHLIEKRRRAILYTNFQDEIGDGQEVVFETMATADGFAKFKEKVRHFLKAHEGHVAIHKLRTNRQLTPTDLAELERMLGESGAGGAAEMEQAKAQSQGLGLFVRSLIGLDRAAAMEAFGEFQQGRVLRANQHAFMDMLIDHLTSQGVVDIGRLYEPPFTGWQGGIDGVFPEKDVDRIQSILEDIKIRAVA